MAVLRKVLSPGEYGRTTLGSKNLTIFIRQLCFLLHGPIMRGVAARGNTYSPCAQFGSSEGILLQKVL